MATDLRADPGWVSFLKITSSWTNLASNYVMVANDLAMSEGELGSKSRVKLQ